VQVKYILDFFYNFCMKYFSLDKYLRIDALDVKEKMAQNALQVFI